MMSRSFPLLVASTLLAPVAGAQVLAQSSFTASAEGWTLLTIGSGGGATPPVTWSATGGNPGGQITTPDVDNGTTYWVAPASWLGPLRGAAGGRITFDAFVEPTGGIYETADVIIRSPSGDLVIDAGPHPSAGWTSFEVGLTACTGWRIGTLAGREPTLAEFGQMLQAATALYIRAEYRNGAETVHLDNPVLRADGAGSGPQQSTFDSSIEGWGVFNDANAPSWVAAGQYLQVVDQGTGIYWYFVAPNRYRGNHADLYGQSLSYDFWTNQYNSNPAAESSVVIAGGGTAVYVDLAAPGVNRWTHYDVALKPASAGGPDWRFGADNGPAATEANLRAVLGCISQLRIRGEYSTSLDTGRLDNVFFGTPIPPCPADFNEDGFLDFFDYDDYVNCFETGNCPPGTDADFNGDGFADFFDYDDFVRAFETGC